MCFGVDCGLWVCLLVMTPLVGKLSVVAAVAVAVVVAVVVVVAV